MLIDDLNAKLGKDIIKGDTHDMSTNGEHLMSIIEKYNLTVVNSFDICRGLFTRVNNKNTMEKSILDYVLVSNDLVSWIVGLQIDEGKLFTPWWKLKRDKRFSDHNAMLLSITATKSSMPAMYKRKLVWNFKEKSGWDKFQKLTTNDQTFSNIWASSDDVEASYKQWSYKLESVINQCFKRRRVRVRKKLYNQEIRSLIKERKYVKKRLDREPYSRHFQATFKKLDRIIDKKVTNFNTMILSSEVNKNEIITKTDFWKLKRILVPKSPDLPHSVSDHVGNDITDVNNIVNQYQNEFVHRLRKREIEGHLRTFEKLQNSLCVSRLQSCKDIISSDFTMDELNQVINKFARGKCADPAGYIREIFICGGKSFRRSVLDMINKIKYSQTPPTMWNKMWVRTIKKKNGSINDLNSYRGVLIGSIVSLISEKLLNLRIIPYLEQNMAKFQTGGMRGKGVTDNLFILRGIIDHSKYLGKELWISFYDIENVLTVCGLKTV